MRNRYIRLLVPVFVFVLAVMIAANFPAAKMMAMQGGGSGSGTGASQGATGTGAVTPDTPDNPSGSYPDATGSNADQGTGVGNQAPGGRTPSATTQAGADANTGRSLGWGSVILSFIAGLIIGGLIFGNRRDTIDRDNLRRRAS